MDFEIITIGEGDNLLLATDFQDGAYLLEDKEGSQILITKEQILEFVKKIGGQDEES
jgi:UDP-N-acetylenolpyruvoylglucosamine reductase